MEDRDAAAFDDDIWELYGPDDWTQAHDLAAENPEKLAELQRLWLIEATKYNVMPLDDRSFERFNPDLAGRPQLIRGHDPDAVLRDAGQRELRARPEEQVALGDREHHRARIRRRGVIVTQGGGVGGWSLYAHEGRLKYCYNFFGIEYYFVTADEPIPAGEHQVRMEFKYDGGGLGKGGDVTLYYDGKAVGTGRVEQTEPMAFSCRRGVRCRFRHRLADVNGLRPHRQQVLRQDRLGAARHRRGRPRST